MAIVTPIIITPDSSHWVKWIDATWSPDRDRRRRALGLHNRLIEQGRIPLLSWQHMEELLGGADDEIARSRLAFIQQLPLIAWLRLPQDRMGVGSIVQVLAAEAIATVEGHDNLISIRDRARKILLRTGSGVEAIGSEAWVWEVARPTFRALGRQRDMVAAFGLNHFDENRTIGELSKLGANSTSTICNRLGQISARLLRETTEALGGDAVRAKLMTEEFMLSVVASIPSPGTAVRDLLVSKLVEQGLDEDEILDDCILADLSRLALLRGQLEVIATETGQSFDELKRVPVDVLPSRVIVGALKTFGQSRSLRPGSDVNDANLAALAAYSDILYVDKRTAQDFQQAKRKEPRLEGLLGEIAKGADFDALQEASAP